MNQSIQGISFLYKTTKCNLLKKYSTDGWMNVQHNLSKTTGKAQNLQNYGEDSMTQFLG